MSLSALTQVPVPGKTKPIFISESMSDTTLFPLSLPDLQHFRQQPTTQTHLIHPTNQPTNNREKQI